MSELPKGWETISFTDLLDVSGGTQPPKSEFISEPKEGYVRLLQIRDFGKKPVPTYIPDTKKLRKCAPEDILIGRYGASLGRICTGMSGSYNVALAKVVIPELLEKQFIKYYLDSSLFQEPLRLLSRSAQNGFNKNDLKEFVFHLAPLAEQKRIVEKLDQVLAQVNTIKARLDGIPAILKRFRQSVLAAAVSGKLTEGWRGKDEGYIDTCGYKTPSSWLQSSIDEESEYVTSGSRGWAQYYSDTGSLFIRSQDINTDELEIDDAAFVKLPAKVEGQRTKVQKEDLLITITGANVTKCARLKIELDDAYISQHVALIRLKNTEDSSFIELVLKALNAGRKQLTDLAYGGGKPGLNLQNIKDVKFSKPIYKEKDEIVRLVDQYFAFADTIEQQVQKAQQRVDKLTQSILAKAFRGELVPQDPTDEPADELLKRIAAARAESEALAKAAKKMGKKTGKG